MASTDIFRERYRENLREPKAIPSGTSLPHKFCAAHRESFVFLSGAGSWYGSIELAKFPLYDRNRALVPSHRVAQVGRLPEGDVNGCLTGPLRRAFVELPVVA